MTDNKDKWLEYYHQGLNDREAAERVGLSRQTISYRRGVLGLPPNGKPGRHQHRFSPPRDQFIQDVTEHPYSWVAKKYGVSKPTVRKYAIMFGIARSNTRWFTKDEDEYILQNQHETYSDIGKALCRHPQIIRERFRHLGLLTKKRGVAKQKYGSLREKIVSEYTRDRGQTWQQLGTKFLVTAVYARLVVGEYLMELCRENDNCSYRALLPEHKLGDIE